MPAVLRPGLLAGLGITSNAPHIRERLLTLGATTGADVLVHASAGEPQAALDGAWDAIRATMRPPRAPGLIVLIAPARGEPARAGLENLARTLSIEWARYGIRPVAILPGARTTPAQTAELVAFLASAAGAYYAGCAFTLR
jgi:NAD(P)-dependent dehydrogenase (short-subunit alcohol dehydrogenase family)